MRRIGPVLLTTLALGLQGCGSSEEEKPIPTEPNQAPSLSQANPDPLLDLDAVVDYDAAQSGATFNDFEGDTLSYTFVFTAGAPPTGLSVAGSHILGTPTRGGRYTVTVTATDSGGLSASDQFDLLIVPGRAARLATPTLPATPFAYTDAAQNLPAHYAQPQVVNADNTPADNPITDAGATLGRVLFYDTRLSITDNVSCGSCHQQAFGFSDPERLSEGFQGGVTGRHSMGLANARYYQRGRFFWDERAATLEAQALQPIQDATEMGLTLPALESKLAGTSFYPPLFQAAFGDPAVTSDRVARALAQFVRSLISHRSRFDQSLTGAVTLTAEEQRGQQLFTGAAAMGIGGGCNSCHGSAAHISPNVFNNGLDATITDAGAGGGRFKSPSLRNIAVRAPYMHEGRFTSLEQVVEFYNSGVQFNPNLAPQLTAGAGQAVRLNLTEADKAALVAFLRTLTDTAMLNDSRFSDPFR